MKRSAGSLTLSLLCISPLCLLVLLTTIPAHADSIAAFSFTSSTYRTDDNDTAQLGYNFTTGSTPITVTALGYINDGFNGTHTISLFQVTTQQIVPGATATVTTVGGGPTSTTFTYTDLTSPVALEPFTQYQIVSQFFAGEHYYTRAEGFLAQFGLTLDTAVYSDYGAPPASPEFAVNTYFPNTPGNFGPNFKVMIPDTSPTPVPELSSIYLIASGVAGFALSRFRKS